MTRRDSAPVGAPCWIDLFTSEPDKTRPFYRDLFGWTDEDAGPEYGGYVTFSKDGVSVAGCMHNDGSAGTPDAWSVYLAVEDAEGTSAKAAEHSGQVYLPPMDVGSLGRMGMVGDPGGAAIGLWQPGEHKGFGILDETGAPSWFELHTRAYDPSVAFYRDVFDWDVHVMSDTDEFRYTTFGEGDDQKAGIMDGSSYLGADAPGRWWIYFKVDDTDASLTSAVDAGGTVLEPAEDTPYGRIAVIADPTGAGFRLQGPNAA